VTESSTITAMAEDVITTLDVVIWRNR